MVSLTIYDGAYDIHTGTRGWFWFNENFESAMLVKVGTQYKLRAIQ